MKRVVTRPEDQVRRGECSCMEPTWLPHITHMTRSKEAALPLLLCWLLQPKKKDRFTELRIWDPNTARFRVKGKKILNI